MAAVIRPVIQIYTMQSPDEARAVAALGVDHIGVTPSAIGLPGEISVGAAAEVCRAVTGIATSVALSVEVNSSAIVAMVEAVQPDIVHLCGPTGAVSPAAVTGLRSRLGGVPIMQAIAVTGPEAVDVARAYEPVVDFLILDSVAADIAGVGAAGKVHDWTISAAIVEAVSVPVVLAGGLSPANVAQAVAVAKPWGVDSLTYTNRLLEDGGFRKDLDLIRQFIEAAHRGSGK